MERLYHQQTNPRAPHKSKTTKLPKMVDTHRFGQSLLFDPETHNLKNIQELYSTRTGGARGETAFYGYHELPSPVAVEPTEPGNEEDYIEPYAEFCLIVDSPWIDLERTIRVKSCVFGHSRKSHNTWHHKNTNHQFRKKGTLKQPGGASCNQRR